MAYSNETALQGVSAPPPGWGPPNFQHPTDVLHILNNVVEPLAIALLAPFVLTRVYIRAFVVKSFGREDWCCVGAWLTATSYCIFGIYIGKHGGGYHEWEITTARMVGFHKALYADIIVYCPCAWFTKTTLLLIMARVFSLWRKTVIFIYGFIIFMFLYYLITMIIKIRSCDPIQAIWNIDLPATCVDRVMLYYTDSTMSAFTDLVIFIVPIPLIWSMQVSFRKKLQIMAVLGAGGLAVAATLIRLALVVQPNSFDDESVSFMRLNILGVTEVTIGIICACVPAFNIFMNSVATKRSRLPFYSRDSNSNTSSFSARMRKLKGSDASSRGATEIEREAYGGKSTNDGILGNKNDYLLHVEGIMSPSISINQAPKQCYCHVEHYPDPCYITLESKLGWVQDPQDGYRIEPV